MLDRLYVELADGDLKLVKLAEAHRDALRIACAADADIWPIYSSSFGPGHFDASFDTLIGKGGRMPYAIFDGDRLVGMTAWLRPDMCATPRSGRCSRMSGWRARVSTGSDSAC